MQKPRTCQAGFSEMKVSNHWKNNQAVFQSLEKVIFESFWEPPHAHVPCHISVSSARCNLFLSQNHRGTEAQRAWSFLTTNHTNHTNFWINTALRFAKSAKFVVKNRRKVRK